MGLVAVAGGFAYKVIHVIWLKKFDLVIRKVFRQICESSDNCFFNEYSTKSATIFSG